MQIPVNKNIDSYTDDFYKGLTMRQTVLSVAAVAAGAAAFMLCYNVLGLGQSASLYAALPVVFPIAAGGFLKLNGMTPGEYLKKKRMVTQTPVYRFVPSVLLEGDPKEPGGKGRKTREKDIYLLAAQKEGL